MRKGEAFPARERVQHGRYGAAIPSVAPEGQLSTVTGAYEIFAGPSRIMSCARNDSPIYQPLELIHLFSDGSCWQGNGGWGTILRQPSIGTEMEMSGYEVNTTNNRMELTAVIKGLEALLDTCQVIVTSDSQYVVQAFTQNWITRWRANGWSNNTIFPLKNKDLWIRMWDLCHLHHVTFVWVKGHSKHPENERCDKLALAARKQLEGLTS